MERAAKLLTKMKLAGCLTPEQVVVAAWPAAAGDKIAAHTKAITVARERLIVEVEDFVWQTQLRTLRHQILNNLERLTEAGLIKDLEFRLAIPKRAPQRAMTLPFPVWMALAKSTPWRPDDLADAQAQLGETIKPDQAPA